MSLSKCTLSFLGVSLAVLAIWACRVVAKQSSEDPNSYPGSWYRLVLDSNGRPTTGDGHGYGNGTWYYYPQTGWYRQWFYNQPFDPSGKGRLKYEVHIKAGDTTKPTTIEINVNWSTPQWSQLGRTQPPLPKDAPTAGEELQYMFGRGLFRAENQYLKPEATSFNFTVEEYCPEWVSVDIRGRNAYVYGAVVREDGKVQDDPIAPGKRLEPQINSGRGGLKWSQTPQQFDPATPFIFNGWGESSNLHLHQIVADDWKCEDDRPITGFQWSGSFQGWTQPALPQDLPLAFHVAIWTDGPQAKPGDSKSFGHPGTLIWETLCTHWTWSIAGYYSAPQRTGDDTCFQFTCLLSQDEWFQPPVTTAGTQGAPTVYWLSIAALYDTEAPAPQHPWGWTTRPQFFNAGAVRITGTEAADPRAPSWPPGPASRWQAGTAIALPQTTAWDLAFELLTSQAVSSRDPDLAPVYRFWSPKLGGHFYTIDEAEKDRLIKEYSEVWTFEGIAFYAYPPDRAPVGSKPIYRFWSHSLGRHFYSASENEKQKLVTEYSKVWTFEGIAWYAFD